MWHVLHVCGVCGCGCGGGGGWVWRWVGVEVVMGVGVCSGGVVFLCAYTCTSCMYM